MAVASTGDSFGLASLFPFCFLFVFLRHQLLDHCSGCPLQCSFQLYYWRHHRLPWVMVALILHGRLGRVVAVARVVNPQCGAVHSLLLVVAVVLPFVLLRPWLDFHVFLLVPHDLRFFLSPVFFGSSASASRLSDLLRRFFLLLLSVSHRRIHFSRKYSPSYHRCHS
ncbi:hypothetical protein TcCL_Unassigned03509 [Trypanosoma cruzi]|nr:hypothetical protein TcCL_Unassigned03509 [Trypanosoma cruzi]